ncbi:MAG: terpene cyclase/mutase family protein [Thermoguttaceae bacterium]|nr:terpene cyclase/mutase family protein [Thermoguttaceae bacterium]
MKSNDDNRNGWVMPPDVPLGSDSADSEARSTDNTADLIRALVRQSRETQNAPAQSAPTPPTAAESDDVVAKVLKQVRGEPRAAGSPFPQPPANDYLPPPAYAPSAPAAPPPIEPPVPPYSEAVSYPVETNIFPSVAPPAVASPPINAPPVVEAKNEQDVPASAVDPEPRKKKRLSKRRKKAKRTSRKEPEEAAVAIGAMAGALVTVANAPSPDEFLTSGALDAAVATKHELSMDELTLRKKPTADSSPDLFLEKLSHTAVPESDAPVVTLHEETALEKVANEAPMWLISLCLHLILIILLAFIFIQTDFSNAMAIISEPGFGDKIVLDEVFDPDAALETTETVEFDTTDVDVQTELTADVPDVSAFNEETAEALTVLETSMGLEAATLSAVENLMGSLTGADLSGRGENKAAMLVAGGGSEGSEKSVALALSWIAEHQLPDGSWSFKTTDCPSCGGQCRNSGTVDAPIAATSMALLPFLAAGHTPTTGKYKQVVARGMNYLTTHGKADANGHSFHEAGGNMYSHGLATIALCETYAMMSAREKARFRELGYVAQDAVRFIEYAQADDGGWRYQPKQAGDTSVAGWQLMALKSAQIGGLELRDDVMFNARDFLRRVATENETRYSYLPGNTETDATCSIGLLCRLYLDWTIDNPRGIQGVTRLSEEVGPKLNVPYYTYYATLLTYNYGGEIWAKWNARVRDNLVKAQCMEGHERGSWYPDQPDHHCVTGGRLYVTSLNCMVLEVYYRHMPLYQKLERNTSFPLDLPTE